jgi:hypothetical protein
MSEGCRRDQDVSNAAHAVDVLTLGLEVEGEGGFGASQGALFEDLERWPALR